MSERQPTPGVHEEFAGLIDQRSPLHQAGLDAAAKAALGHDHLLEVMMDLDEFKQMFSRSLTAYLSESGQHLTPPPQSHLRVADLTNEQKEITLLRIIAAMGEETDSSDYPYSWLTWFCSDEIHNVQDDTFNRCNEKGWLHTTHNTDMDTSTTTLTAGGRAMLTENTETNDGRDRPADEISRQHPDQAGAGQGDHPYPEAGDRQGDEPGDRQPDAGAHPAGTEQGLRQAGAVGRELSAPVPNLRGEAKAEDCVLSIGSQRVCAHGTFGCVNHHAPPPQTNLRGNWLPIEQADKSIDRIIEGAGLRIGSSEEYWVRDADGRIYQAAWAGDGKRAYWWDLDGESPADPVEFMPHPLDTRFTTTEGSADA